LFGEIQRFREILPGLLSPEMVDNGVSRDLIQPALKTGLVFEGLNLGLHLQEDVLNQIIDREWVWNPSVNEATKLAGMFVPDAFR
jgi:hypothetical protein